MCPSMSPLPPKPRGLGTEPDAPTKFWKRRSISARSRERSWKSKSGIHSPMRRPPVASSVDAGKRKAVPSNPIRPSTTARSPPPPIGIPKRPRTSETAGPGWIESRAAPLACVIPPSDQRSVAESAAAPESPVPGSCRSPKKRSTWIPLPSSERVIGDGRPVPPARFSMR